MVEIARRGQKTLSRLPGQGSDWATARPLTAFQSRRGGGHDLPSNLVALEPRVMLDGAAAIAAIAETVDNDDQAAEAQEDGSSGANPQTEQNGEPGSESDNSGNPGGPESAPNDDPAIIVIVDAAIKDPETLLTGLDPSAEVFYLNPGEDGVARIATILSGFSEVGALHILSHGAEGSVTLGATTLDLGTIESHASGLAAWGAALGRDADVLLYGCNVGAASGGRAFIEIFADLTGADVSASTDVTGSQAAGGDWTLETATGDIEATAPFASAALTGYAHLLMTAPPEFTGDLADGNETIAIDEHTAAGNAVFDVDANDGNGGLPDAGVTFSITAGNTDTDGDGTDAFAIDAVTGVIAVADADDLDFEDVATFTLTVQADDGGPTDNLSTATVTINLNDIGDIFTVTTLADEGFSFPGGTLASETNDGEGLSLREAISLVNATGGSGTANLIVFDPTLAGGTITLTDGIDALNRQLVIGLDTIVKIDGDTDGDEAADITISAADFSRVFSVNGADLRLDSLTITGGAESAIATSNSDLTIVNSTLTGNTSTGGQGGALSNFGSTTTIVNSTISENTSTGANAISNSSGTVTLVNTTIANNTGTSNLIANTGTLEIFNSTFSGNRGSLFNFGVGQISAANSILSETAFNSLANVTLNGRNIVGTNIFDGAVDVGDTSPNQIFASVATSPLTGLLQGVLANNRGPVRTIAILENGDAHDTGISANLPGDAADLDGDNDTSEQVPVDARGFDRIFGATVDLGATERLVGVNTVPDSTDSTVTVTEDVTYTFTLTDFPFIDADPGDQLLNVRIETLPDAAAGQFLLNGTPVTIGQIIDRSDIIAGALTFTPTADLSGAPATAFNFSVSDGLDFQASPNTLTIDIAAIADTPGVTIGLDSAFTFGTPVDVGNGPRQVVDLAAFDASLGFIVISDIAGDGIGFSVSEAGDVNGDGFADIILGASRGDDGGIDAGEAYVLFGTDQGFGSPSGANRVVDLTNLSAAQGFIIQGDVAGGLAGSAVSGAGDVNGDGFDDVIVGALRGDVAGNDAGEAYVVFGSDQTIGTNVGGRQVVDLTTLSGTQGFVILGDQAGSLLGAGVSAAGDFNGDGFDDILVGASSSSGSGAAPATFLIFGTDQGFGTTVAGRQVLDTSVLAAGDIVRITGGSSIGGINRLAGLGDVNGDGFDDFVLGDGALPGDRAYVIFGTDQNLGTDLDLDTLGSTRGFVIEGDAAGDFFGIAVSGAGDVNRDGFADILVGASAGDDGGNSAGEAYVLFGTDQGFGTVVGSQRILSTNTLSASEGFIIQGDVADDQLGTAVSAAGDVNDDGFDDIIISALRGDDGGNDAGEAYVVFGGSGPFGTATDAGNGLRQVLDLTTLSSGQGFIVQGPGAASLTGTGVSGAGDVNGDGVPDFIVGSSVLDQAHIIFGLPAPQEDTTVGIDISATVTDALANAHSTETITALTIVGLPAGSIITDGSAVNTAVSAGPATPIDVLGWDLTNLLVTPAPDFNGALTLTVEATASESANGDAATASASLIVNFTPVPDDVVANPDTIAVVDDAPIIIDVLANDVDPDGDPITFVSLTQPAMGTASLTDIDGDGTDDAIAFTPSPGFFGASFEYTITDGSTTATTTVDITNNRPLVVSTTADEFDNDFSNGDLSLREAVFLAGQGFGTDADGNGQTDITFDAGLFGAGAAIVLNGSAITVGSAVEISGDVNGDGRADVTLDGDDTSRVLDITGSAVTLNALAITGGNSGPEDGGGIRTGVGTSVIIRNTTITGNTSGAAGGGVSNDGNLTFANTTIAGNNAVDGGGIRNFGDLTAINLTLHGNTASDRGGALFGGGTATLIHTTITANMAADSGSGAFFSTVTIGPNPYEVTNSIILGNGEAPSQSPSNIFPFFTGHNIFGQSASGPNFTSSFQPFPVHIFAELDPATGNAVLADNGGFVPTVALTADLLNIAVDIADPASVPSEQALGVDVDGDGAISASPVGIDARGLSRISGTAPDLGAFELAPFNGPFVGPLVVSTTADVFDGDFSAGNLALREATFLASQGFGTDGDNDGLTDITFDATLFGGGATITLTGREIAIGSDLAIFGDVDGDGTADVTLDGDNLSRIFLVQEGPTTALFDSLILINGETTDALNQSRRNGGAIAVEPDATATIRNSEIRDNNSAFRGGGVAGFRGSTVNIVDSLITGNEAGDSGGGLYILGSGTVSDTIIDNNTAQRGGGGITVDGNAEITSSILSNNSAIQGGGGIAVRSFFDLTTFTRVTAEVSISGSLIEGNTGGSGGGAQVDGEASFVATTIRGNEALFTEIGQPQVGGGVAVRGSATFVGTTISGNRATFGGDGVFVGDNFDPATGPVTATFVNSTIAHNPSAFGRHGLLTDGDHATTLINTTVTGNRVILDPTGTTTIANSIIFGTFNSATVSTLSGTATLLGGNIIGDTNGGQFTIDGVAVPAFANLQTGDVFVALDPSTSGGNLSDNGGPVETVAIRANPNTPVFDQGDASLLPSEQDLGVDIDGDGTFSATPIAIDARGFSRIVDLGGSGSGLDLGAFEVQAPVVADDAVTVQEDIVTTIDVLANDNAGGLAVTSVGPATNGTTSLVGGQVRYTPNSDFNGTDSFTYSVTGAFGTETATVAVTVAPVNDAPVLTGLDTTLSFMVGDQPLLIDGDVAVFDVEQNWDGGTLSVTGLAATDNVAVRSSGGVTTISGNEISVGGIPVATFTGGQNGTDLLITLNAQATSAAVEAIIENLVFSNDSFAPAAERTLLLQLTDGDGTQARGPVYATVPIPEADRPVGGTFQAGIPQFVDIDNDGDLDAFVGTQTGIEFFRNDGDPATPAYVAVSGAGNPFNSFNQTFNAGGLSNAAPSFADIDGDGDFDAFIGDNTNAIPRFFRNDGTANAPIFTLVTGGSNPFDGAGTGNNTAPAVGFVDIDNDGDLDAFLGLADGTIAFRQNDGTTLQADFVAIGGVDNPLNGIVASGGAAKPAFVDIDNDGDFDAILGNLAGTLQFLRNDGDAATPSFVEIGGSENPFDGIDVGNDSSPTFADIDNGGAPDLFVGRRDGTLAAFQGDTGFGIETTINRTLVVTTLQDEADGDFSFGDLSLREAIALAGLGIGTDTNGDGLADITFDPTLFASGETIVLSLGQLEITSDLSIDGDVDGDNRADVTIDGGLLNRVFDVTAGTVLLDSLSISGGDAGAGDGGGLRIGTAADVTIRNTTISGNQAGGDGGGIFNEGTLALANATIDNNDATNGAGIANDGGLVAVNTTLFGNRATGIGGGLYTTTDATLAHTTVAGNSADINGGVFAQLDLVQPVTFTITNSIVLGNTENILDPRDVGGTFALTPDRQGNNILAGVLFEGNVPISLPGSINVFSDIDPNTGLPLLADNGGPVRTVALRDDLLNPALDGSDPAVVPTEQDLGIDVDGSGMIDNLPIGIDARGLSRSVGSAQDLGAFEVQPLAVNFIGPLVVSTDTDIDDGDFSQGNLSLREAIRLARAGFGTDGDGDGLTDITFDAALFGGGQTITLGGTELVLGSDVAIFGDVDGNGIADVTLDGDGLSRIFQVLDGSEVLLDSLVITGGDSTNAPDQNRRSGGGVTVLQDGVATIRNSTLTGNFSASSGGGVAIFGNGTGSLSIVDSLLSGNTSALSGGGVAFFGSGDISGTTIVDNESLAGAGGGVIVSAFGIASVDISATLIQNNRAIVGGGLTNSGDLSVSNSQIIGNQSTGLGGGGGLTNSGILSVVDSRIVGNQSFDSGGGITINGGQTLIASTTIADNDAPDAGGGIHLDIALSFGSAVELTVLNSTLSGNTAETGGGVFLSGSVIDQGALNPNATFVNTTIAANTASGPNSQGGGGLFVSNFITSTIINSTVTGNDTIAQGNGLFLDDRSTVTATNSIIFGNAPPLNPSSEDVGGFGILALTGGNIIGSGGIGEFSENGIPGPGPNAFQVGDIFQAVDPLTGGGLLTDNGGPVQTVALNAALANPALDSGDQTLIPSEQSVGFDVDGNAQIDPDPIDIDARGLNRFVATVTPTAETDLGAYELQQAEAQADAATTLEDTPVTIDVLANDNALVGVPVLASVTAPVNGLAEIVGDQIRYTPNPNFAGTDTFTYSITANGQTATATVTVTVDPVNDAPAGTDTTIVLLEGGTHTFSAADFGFTDPLDTPPDSFISVVIASVPSTGTLALNGIQINAGDEVALADIGTLVYTPDPDLAGDAADSLTFQVRDDGGTANGGIDLDPSPNTITFDITPVNDAPAGTDMTVTVPEDGAHTFSAADFGFTDPSDNPSNAFASVIIVTVPATGTLVVAGVPVGAGDEIAVVDIPSLVYAPPAGLSGNALATFDFQVRDDGGTANGGIDLDPTPNTITVDVTPVNDAPSGSDVTIAIQEDTGHTFSAADFGFADPDDIPADNFAALVITTLPSGGTLLLSGTPLVAGATITVADIGTLVFVPDANLNGAGAASFTFQVQDDGGTANGGQDTDPTPNTVTFDIAAVNDAPVIAGPNGQSVSLNETLVFSAANGNQFSIEDVDAGNATVTATLTATLGTIDVGGGSPAAIAGNGTTIVTLTGSVADINAAISLITFSGNAAGTGAIEIAVNDAGNTGAGGPLAANAIVTVQIEAVLPDDITPDDLPSPGFGPGGSESPSGGQTPSSLFTPAPGNPVGFAPGPGTGFQAPFGGLPGQTGGFVDPIQTAGLGGNNNGPNQGINEGTIPGTIRLAPTSDTGNSASDGITRDSTPSFTGVAPANALVTIRSSLSGVIGTAQADENGNWSFDAGLLPEGVHELVAIPSDADGNEGTLSVPLLVTLDLTIPEKPAVPARDGSTAATSDEPGSFSGTAEPGARIVLRSDRDGVVGEAVADENGNWEIVVDTLSVNTHALTVTATDAAGNESPASDPLVLNVVQQASERQPAAPVDLASLLSGFRDNVPANDGGTAIDSGAVDSLPAATGFGRQLQIAGRDKAMSDLMRGAA